MSEQVRGAGQPTWPLSPYQIQVSYGQGQSTSQGASSQATSSQVTSSNGIARGSGADWFGPLDPMRPIAPPDVAGRRFDFPPGYNLVTRPRAYESIGFAELRGFADAYDLLRLVIETRKDQMERQRWRIRPRDAKAKRRSAAVDPQMTARIAEIEAFFQKPDGITRWKTWLRALLEDMFVIDAATLYCQRTRSGQLCALQQLDGATIKRVIDDWGRTPQPFAAADGTMVCPPAYQQVLKGLPAINYSARDIVYRPRNVRAHRVYGYSPVQQVLMTVNIALRRQLWQLDYFTEGSIPDALIGVPQGWTPDQIKQFQDYWDTEFAGDLAKRRRAKFVPGETAAKVVQTKEPQHKDDFDEWLARIICFAFSVPPQWATKAMNRATAQNQSEQAEEEGLEPTKEWVKDLIDEIVAEEFASPDLELHWLDEDEGDPETVLEGRLKVGALTLNEMRDALGLDPFDNAAADRPMVLTATGFVPIEANAGGEGEDAANVQSASAVQKYSSDQPRVPAGNPHGGEWTKGDAESASSSDSSNVADNGSGSPRRYAAQDTGTLTVETASAPSNSQARNDSARSSAQVAPDDSSQQKPIDLQDEEALNSGQRENNDARVLSDLSPEWISGAQYAVGWEHHYMPWAKFKDLPLQDATRQVFVEATSGPLADTRVNRWSPEHAAYNDAVDELFKDFLKRNSIPLEHTERLTPGQAEQFIDEVFYSSDPRIRSFNMRIWYQAFKYWRRGRARGTE